MPNSDFPLLTKESEYLLGLIYKRYLERRGAGSFREDARYIGSSAFISENIMPECPPEDVTDLMRELCAAEVVQCIFAEETVCESELTNFGIIVMENRCHNRISEVVSFLATCASFIPQLLPNPPQ